MTSVKMYILILPILATFSTSSAMYSFKLNRKMDLSFNADYNPDGWSDFSPITNYKNMQYYMEITLGSPPQKVNVQLDTGSSDFWVYSSQCNENNKVCQSHASYNHNLSYTYIPNGMEVDMSYVKGNAKGFISTDMFCLTDCTPIVSPINQSFVEVVDTPGNGFAQAQYDGIMGLGFPSLSKSRVMPPMMNLWKYGSLQRPVFAFQLNRYSDITGDEYSVFSVGETLDYESETDYESRNVIPVSKEGYWQFDMDKISVDDKEHQYGVFCANGCQAFMDTGSSFIAGPMNDVIGILHNITHSRLLNDHGMPVINCNDTSNLPSVTFYIHGKAYTFESNDYIVKFQGKGREECGIGIVGLNANAIEPNTWIMGDVFLQKYFTLYNFVEKTITVAEYKSSEKSDWPDWS